jgi:hypothetical protein
MGNACYHLTDWNPEVGDLSLKLFQWVGLRGLANAEFKRDERDGKLKLIECNARFTASIAGVSMCVMLLAAAHSDRKRERFYHAAASGVFIAIGFIGAALLPQPVMRIAFLGLVIIGSNMMLAPFWCMPTLILSGEAAAVGIALINSLGNLGGFIGPYAIGFLNDATGSNEGSFLGLAACGVGVAVFCVSLRFSTIGRVASPPAPALSAVEA